MDFLIVGLVAFLASGLTLYSGFGLGTVLLPAFALFFPVQTAVAATGVVHLFNNLFKGGLLGRQADWRIVARFGVPAVPAAVLGAWLLAQLGQSEAVFRWHAFGHSFAPSGAGVTVGLLLILLALLELQPGFQKVSAPLRLMPLGGLVTGFVGGLTGQQGALRSMFLLRTGLQPRAYIATGVMIAILIDLSRIPTYLASFDRAAFGAGRDLLLIAVGTVFAFAGAWLGARRARKVTLRTVRAIVTGLMLAIGAALVMGLVGT